MDNLGLWNLVVNTTYKNRIEKMIDTKDPFFNYHNYLEVVQEEDFKRIKAKEETYQGSWKRSGGRSAYFMIQRKMDRIPILMKEDLIGQDPSEYNGLEKRLRAEDDIFKKIELNPSDADGTVLAEIRDLRAYLTLVEAEMMARGVIKNPEIKSVYEEYSNSVLIKNRKI
jgi:hypothetical protein